MTPLPLLADVADAATHCSFCPKMCRYACPVAAATGRESVTPWGIDREIAQTARTGEVTEATARAVYACTGCRSCGGACLPGLDLPTHVRAARAAVVEAGLEPAGVAAAAGAPAVPAAALESGATAGADVVMFPGCHSADGAPLAALLRAAGVAYDVVREAACCGAHTADVGLAADAEDQARDLEERLLGAETVVVADPHCARRLRFDRVDARVVPLAVFLSRMVGALRFSEAAEPVAWHDPCWLGRGLAVYEEPRALVAAASGAPVAEAEHARDRAGCTGGGMGYPLADPAGAEAVLQRRVEELGRAAPDSRPVVTACPPAGADGRPVVTACPLAAARLRGAGLPAHDLAAYLAGRLAETRS